MHDIKRLIGGVLRTFADRSLREGARSLLGVLGYQSDRVPALDDKSGFLGLCEAERVLTDKQLVFMDSALDDVKSVFQFTEDELFAQDDLFDATGFKDGLAESFLFLAIDLVERDYTRTHLVDMTRATNRLFAMPTILMFRYRRSTGDPVITIGVVHRRPHKKDSTRDVLERVTLVKDIRTRAPHRAHLDVLAGLSVWNLARGRNLRNFDQLHEAWERALDTEPLNQRFYKELFRWFERAVVEATWPADAPREQQVIRCITRVLFVWFIKEKGLVAEDWFERERMEELLVGFGGSDYYRAALQNLFFATLNTPAEQRTWTTRSGNHEGFIRWRYRSLVRDPKRFEALMEKTPFINGGLFDCLDDEDGEGRRIDMFSDPDPADGPAAEREHRRARKTLRVPDELFFDEHGLCAVLNRFKFTVEENTPAEIEVALDPELLGKVFEHLLAAYNPETRDTARKQTGSYYTPRPVVDYMVDEALVIALAEKAQPDDGDANFWRERLRYLLDYEDAGELFEANDALAVVRAIADLKVLDPSVGSGAFPMAVLNKLTLALRRLDPTNEVWQKLQKEAAAKRSNAAFENRNKVERDAELLEISKTFERYSNDFGRKLYLIQNSIYGVDIQAIACQIAKLRFFISLAIEQQPDPASPNFGIKPLPNLETRFVAADTLLELQRDRTLATESERVHEFERQLLANRERHFHANSRQSKLDCMTEDWRLRSLLAAELEELGLPGGSAKQVARWNPYDQNEVAHWFDTEYMFGVNQGFDIVIGNPPYIQLQKNRGELGKRYKSVGYETFVRTGDIYLLFFEKGCRLLGSGGALAYITSNSWLRAKYGERLREYLARHHTPLRLIDMGKDVFDAVVVDASVLTLRSGGQCNPFLGVDTDRADDATFPPPRKLWGQVRPNRSAPWSILTNPEWRVMEKMKSRGTPLKDWDDISIYYGIKTGYNSAFIIDTLTRDRLVAEDPRSADILKRILRGRDIQRYRASWAGLWLITTHNGYGDVPAVKIDEYPAVRKHLDHFYAKLEKRYDKGSTPYNLRNCAYQAEFRRQKLFWIDLSDDGRFSLSSDEVYCLNSAYMLSGPSMKYLCCVLNSHLIRWFMRHTALNSGMGVVRWFGSHVEEIPIPELSSDDSQSLIQLIDEIIRVKNKNIAADTSQFEAKIDEQVYELYGLSPREIWAILS